MRSIFVLLSVIAYFVTLASTAADEVKQREFFEARIRPVLIKHCYACHSADAKEIKGELRLDHAAGLLKGGELGPALVPGKPEESALIEAIKYEGLEMPPDGRLPKQVVADFERWIKSGAFDPRTETPATAHRPAQRTIDIEAGKAFWAFQPVRRHEAPPVGDKDWPATDIDAFVLAKLKQADLRPARDADRRTLVRRLYFDLIGLPPSPEEVAAFVKDDSPDAWPRLVDRLLESNQFGIKWGRHWLDVARYADSNGGDFNATFHNAWRYRDYVIDSFNNDKPFDEFVREQLAGDLLSSKSDAERTERIIATGFLMLGTKMLSERDKLKLTMDVVDEQINTVGQAFMGLTLGCARCHDHKFDPIPTTDYYALAGIFRSTRTLQGESQQYVSTWPRRSLPAEPKQLAAVEKHQSALKQIRAQAGETKKRRDELTKRLAKLKSGQRSLTFDDADAKVTGIWKSSTYHPLYVGKGYIHDDQSEKGEKWVEFSIKVPRDASYDVQLSYSPGSTRAAHVPISIKHADGEVEVALNQQRKPPLEDLFASVGKFRFAAGQPGELTVSTRGTEGYVIVDAVRLVELDGKGKPVQVSDDTMTEEKKELEIEIERAAAESKRLEAKLKQQENSAPAPLPKAIAVDEGAKISDCEICVRGEHRNRGPIVKRGVIQVATAGQSPQFTENQSGRRELAEWLTSADHPLTARVYVNRLWHHLIGRGIVASADNFGHLGDRPTHPELLDRLASDFVQDGWSTKRAIRRIVLSRVYRMSSRHDEQSWKADPENQFLWRAHRRRLPAESIRDAMAAISGQLDLSPGGSPVAGLGTLVTQNNSEAKKFDRKESLRRSAYLPMIRSELPAILTVFDFADPDLVTGRRSATNVPAQALLLLNSPFVMQQATHTATVIEKRMTGQPLREQVTYAYDLVLSRPASEGEVERAMAFLESAESGRDSESKDSSPSPLAQLIHTLFASIEFRMLN